MNDETPIVQVRRQPGDWRLARCALDKLEDLRWGRVGGGIQQRSALHVYGYMWCNDKIDGRIAHSCSHGPPPHRIKVCITKKFNEDVWTKIIAIVGPKPLSWRSRAGNDTRRKKRRTRATASRAS